MGISTDQGLNINMSQNMIENSQSLKKNLKADEKVDKDNIASMVATKDGAKGLGLSLISDLMRKMADNDVGKLNKQIQKGTTDSFQSEIDSLYKREDQGEDGAKVSKSPADDVLKDKNLKELKNTLLTKTNYFTNMSTTQKQLMSEYVANYQGAMAETNPQQRTQTKEFKQMKVLEEQLKQQGMSEDRISDFRTEVRDCAGAQGQEKQQKMNSLMERGKKFFDTKITKDQRELLTEFFDSYPQYLIEDQKGQQRQEVKEKVQQRMEELEQKLEDSGISKKEIAQAKEAVNNEMVSGENDKQTKKTTKTVLDGNKIFGRTLSGQQKVLVSEFMNTYPQSLIDDQMGQQRQQVKDRLKQRMEELEQKLQDAGISRQEIDQAKLSVNQEMLFNDKDGKKNDRQLSNLSKFFTRDLNGQQKTLVEEFMQTYPEYLKEDQKGQQQLIMKARTDQKLQDLEKKLQDAGISKQEIDQAKQAVTQELSSGENEKENKKADKQNTRTDKPMFKNNKFFARTLNDQQKALVQEFVGNYPKAMQIQAEYGNGAQKLSHKVVDLERQLQHEGMSSQQLQDLKVQIKYSIRGSLVKQLVDSKVNRILNERSGEGINKIPLLIAQRQESFSRDFMLNNHKLGGADFGNYREAADGVGSHTTGMAYEEVRTFGMDEIINCLIRAKNDPDKAEEEMKNIEKLAYLVGRSDGDLSEVNKVMKTVLDDIGFVDFRIEDFDTAGGGGPGDQNQKERHPDYGQYAFSEDDEREILINRYKSLLMRRAINPDAKTYLETAFKLRRTKQGMIQLGIFSPKIEEELSESARKMAIEKLMEMLKEGLIERASFYVLDGSAHNINERKLKSILKNMENLDCAVSLDEFKLLRDQASKRIFDLSNRELQMVNLAYKNNPQPYFAQKRSQLIKLLTRLKEEANIALSISYDVDAFNAMVPKDSKGDGLADYIWDDIQIKLGEAKYDFGGSELYKNAIEVIVVALEGGQVVKDEALQKDIDNAKKYIEDTFALQEEKDHRLTTWANELRVMLFFVKNNTKNANVPVLDKLINLLEALTK